jgi:predicted RNA-binding Zn-ribbon protein involved in translation (DUF1610 family)
MSPNTVILALVLFPLLYVLPLNLIRFQWGFKKGFAPMPPEVEERAELADRAVLFATHVMLLAVVVLLIRGSPISAYAVGITANNWKSALGVGFLFSVFPLGLFELATGNLPLEEARKDSRSRGPAATWYGLTALGSFSHEFWRAFCIVALIRLGLSAWLAVIVAAVFMAPVSLQTSVARALGAAAFGVAAGYLFVHTGSLLAPVTMSLITSAANVYQVRHAPSFIKQIDSRQGIQLPESRFSRPCPVCGAIIRLSEIHQEVDMLTCPHCGECLTYQKKHFWVIGVLSLVTAVYATRHLIYRDPLFFLVTEGVALVLYFIGIISFGLLVPRRYKKVQGNTFDKALSLFWINQSDTDKKSVHE